MPPCINLRTQYGKRYRVVYEESYYAQYGPNARVEDPWLMILSCKFGHIFAHGGNMLAASVDGHPNVAGLLRRLKCCHVCQDGDDGITVLFGAADFAQVAKVMKPRRRRQMTEEQKRIAAERLAKYAFRPARQNAAEGQTALAMAEMASTSTRAKGTQQRGKGEAELW